MPNQKRACLIYVTATEAIHDTARSRLEQCGYSVCEVKADLEDAIAAQEGESNLPAALVECISSSDLCVFLLPEDESNDSTIDGAADLANQLGRRIVGIVAGARTVYPKNFDDHAHSMVRVDSDRVNEVICGAEVWEQPDRSPVTDRPIKHIRCQ